MQCPRCQQENTPQAKFCLECGGRLALTCTQCGIELPAGAKFCLECGQSVSGRSAGQSRFAAPEVYTPKHLAEQILTSRSAVEGERKQVTVLFADLKGSLELLAARDPEEARKLLDPVLERMMEAVHRYEGTVNQVMGDGIMALFGAPLAHEDHAVRACYAALRMQEAVKRYAQEVQRTEGLPIQIRVGLNSGEVVVRSIGSDLRMDYSAVGQTTHLAARMEQMAMPGSILITGGALRLAEGYVQAKPLGPVRIKGLSEPAEVYEVTGAGPVRTRLQAAATRGLTRFVGRQTELDQLRQALEQAWAGHGQVVALVGEPGVGKSRLFWEFTRSHRTHSWLILESGSVSYGKATSYLPVCDLLKAYFGIEARDDGRRIREKLTGKLLTLDEALKPTLPAFLALLEVPVDDPAWQAFDPPQRRQRTLEAVKRLLLRESQVQPLVVVFEDLHWIDAETQALLDSLIESLPTARILLLVNYRPEYRHGWGSKTYYIQLRLDPLPPESAEELLQALLGEGTGFAPFKQLLIARTEGNPFFLEESIRTLVETQVLLGERGAYRLVKALPTIQVPATVQAVLAARIDRLPPEEKRLLQSAAVIGKDVPFALLEAIADGSEEGIRPALAHLQAAEFLYEARLFPELEYTFKHALTHEVAYRSILQQRRRELHSRILETLESLYPDRLAEQVEWLAHHALRGEVWGKALTYFRQAGTKAVARSAYREAVACFEQALVALKHLPENRDTSEQAIDLRLDLRHSLFPLGEFGRMLDHLREAETLATALDDQPRLRRVTSYMSQNFRAWGIANFQFLMGDHERAVASGQRALAMATATGDFARQVMANYSLGEAYHALGDYRRALDFLRQTVAVLEGELVRARFSRLGFAGLPFVFSHAYIVRCFAELGEFAEGIARGNEGVRIAEAVGQSVDLIGAYSALGALYLRQGDLPKAIPTLERCLALSGAQRHPYWFPMIASSLAFAYALSERFAEALPLLEEAVEQSASMRIMGGHSLQVAWLSEAYLLTGRREEAIRLARGALELASEHKERGIQAWVLRLLGDIAAQCEPPEVEQAEGYYRQGMALAEELGMRPPMAHCHLGLGTLSSKIGRREQARAELSSAIDLYRAMQMAFWLTQAEAALAQT
ncbi:MAG: AAA family ATPase [Nitrospinae bacterium]|nr:AAA family ATPase [Nitrospinota bacterium]